MNDARISSGPGLQQLIERFPRLFRGAQPAVWSHVPVGWSAIVETLFTGINALLNDDQAKSFRVEQVKEKFGTLRLYVSFDRIDAGGVNPKPAVPDVAGRRGSGRLGGDLLCLRSAGRNAEYRRLGHRAMRRACKQEVRMKIQLASDLHPGFVWQRTLRAH